MQSALEVQVPAKARKINSNLFEVCTSQVLLTGPPPETIEGLLDGSGHDASGQSENEKNLKHTIHRSSQNDIENLSRLSGINLRRASGTSLLSILGSQTNRSSFRIPFFYSGSVEVIYNLFMLFSYYANGGYTLFSCKFIRRANKKRVTQKTYHFRHLFQYHWLVLREFCLELQSCV